MDEIINESLQEEASRNRALALYEGTRDDDLVSEEVDERILKLLGLDDVFDIDYGTYMTLLREKMAEARMVDKKLSTEETMLITEEFKRVKGKVGRFKLKKKKITAENLGVTGPVRVSNQQYYLTSKAIVPELQASEDKGGELFKNILSINQVLVRILESIGNQNKIIKKGEETDRKRREDQKRRKVEEGLEKGLSKVASLASKMLAPVQSILDRILNFILYTLLGRAFVKFIDWFNNPKNKEKVEVLKRFLKDWWPALLGALVLFTTPFGAFVRGFIGTVTKLTFRLARFAIPKLLSFTKSNPLVAAGVATGLAAGAGFMMEKGRRDERIAKEAKKEGKTPEQKSKEIEKNKSWFDYFGSGFKSGQLGMGGISPVGLSGGGVIPLAKAFTGGGERDSLTPYTGDGFITDNTGVTVTGAGRDTQATVLRPGEIVFSKESVDYWGADRLLKMNKVGGGTNAPKFVNNIQMAVGGGMIGRRSKSSSSPSIQMGATNIKMPNIGGFSPRVSNRQTGSNINIRGSKSTSKGYSGRSSVSNNIQNYYRMPGLSSGNNLIMNQNSPAKLGRNSSSFTQNIFSAPSPSSNISYSPVNISTQITSSQRRPVSPGPPVANNARSSFIELPPIVQQAAQQVASAGGTKIPPFMAPDSTTAVINASIYGIA